MSRLLQKILSLTLALAILLPAGFASAADSEVAATAAAADTASRSDAAELLSMLGLLRGNENGGYDLERAITRAEAAAMISRALWGGVDDVGLYVDGNPGGYLDTEGHWSAGYINYCTARGLFSGDGSGYARPDSPMRTAELCKMALVALGYSPSFEEYTGAKWAANVTGDAEAAGLLDGVEADPLEYISRGDAVNLFVNLLYANIVVYVRGSAIFVPAGSAVSNQLGGYVTSLQPNTWRTFGMEYLDFISVTGVLWANGYALLDGAPEQYTHASFSPAPNGVSTLGGLLRASADEWYEIDSVSPPLELIGRAVTVEFADGRVLSVRRTATNVEFGSDYSDRNSIAPNVPVYVNYSLSDDGRSALASAIADGCNITFVSNDGNRLPDIVFIDREVYAGQLESVGAVSYPGYGYACTFSEAGVRYSEYIVGRYEPGMYMSIRQIGLYSFVEQAEPEDVTPTEAGSAGIALITDISCSADEDGVAVSIHAILETGEHGHYRIAYVLDEGEAVPLAEFAGEMTAIELTRALPGDRTIELDGGAARDIAALVAYDYTESGEIAISPSLDYVGAELSSSPLTVYSDYQPGDASLGLGDDGRDRYVAESTVLFIEGANGWEVFRGSDIPPLVRRDAIVRPRVAYSNMFSLDQSDWLQVRALVAPDGMLASAAEARGD